MIWNTDLNSQKSGMYKEALKNLERAKAILDERYAKKEISDSEYMKRFKEMNQQIEKYRSMCGE